MEPSAAAPGGYRRVLRRLRDTMAGAGTAQQRLNAVVHIIAGDMVAEVCSCYVMRAGEVLELFATEGLRPEAVHRTRLRVGEGLVGVIAATARPLALADAQSHPDFAYRPETGEEIFHSLLGVPILRGGHVLGVLVVQNRTLRHYTDDEVEALQTIAMIVAEMVASGELVNPHELQPANVVGGAQPLRLEGVRINGGLAQGAAVLHEPRVVIRQVVAEHPQQELERLRRAVTSMQSAIDDLLAASDVADHGEPRDVLESYRMFAADRGWVQRMTDAVRSGLTAEAAVQKVQEDTRARLSQASDPYLRERRADLDDLASRLQQHLSGRQLTAAAADLPDEFILIARAMGPAELLDYDRRRLKGLVLEEGSPTAHVAIVARALDIPVVGRVNDVLSRVETGDLVAVDGDDAVVVLRPSEDVQQAIEQRLDIVRGDRLRYATLRDVPAETLDGVRVSLQLNSGLLIDLALSRRDRCRGHRPVPYRAAVHAARPLPDGRTADPALSPRAGAGRRPAGDVPHPRRRRRQAAALYARQRRREPGDGLARHPHRARPAGDPAAAAPGAHPRRLGPAAARHVPDDRRSRRTRSGARCPRSRIGARLAPRLRPAADLGRGGRHA